jgi:cytochrome c
MKRILMLGACALFIACNSSSEKVTESGATTAVASDTSVTTMATDSTASDAVSTVTAVPEKKASEVKLSEVPAQKTVVKESKTVAEAKSVGNNDSADIKKGEMLISKSDCFACHKVQDKLLGPPYKDVANKYEKTKSNIDYLVNKVKNGGSGVWGQVPMSPHPTLSDDDLRAMILYVLSLK